MESGLPPLVCVSVFAFFSAWCSVMSAAVGWAVLLVYCCVSVISAAGDLYTLCAGVCRWAGGWVDWRGVFGYFVLVCI